MKSLFQIVTEADKKPKKDDYEDLDNSPEEDDEDTGTDYTEDPDSTDASTDEASTDEDSDPADEDGDSTDYTVDTEDVSPDDSDDTDTPSDDDSSTDADSTDSEPTEDTPEATPADNELSRQLIEDFSRLYHLCDNTVMKLTQVDKSNILVNQIVTRIISNINQISKHLFDYIVYQFDKGKYPYNLYRYNQFVESFRINVEMLKKINVLTANSQNN